MTGIARRLRQSRVCYNDDTGYVTLEGMVMEVPSSLSGEFDSWILELNLTSPASRSGFLVHDHATGSIIWADSKPIGELTDADFQIWLDKSVSTAELWTGELEERANSDGLGRP